MIIDQRVEKIYQIIRNGGLVIFPSNVGYALFGHSDESMQLMFQIKQRPYTKASVVIGNLSILEEVAKLTKKIREAIEFVVKDYPCAFIVPANESSTYLNKLGRWALKNLITDGYIAVFLNIGDLATQLVVLGEKEHFLIIGSSANHSGAGNNYIFSEVEKEITDAVQGSIDDGPSRYTHPQNRGTTIINFFNNSIQRDGILCTEILIRLKECGIIINK